MPKISLLGLDPLQMFDSFGNFKPVRNYQDENKRLFEYGRGLQIPSRLFATIIQLEYFSRVTRQSHERLEKDFRSLKDPTKDEIQVYESDLEDIKEVTWNIAQALYNTESMLPQRPLRKIYDEIRQNPAWYLRKELIQACMRRGGCCGRSCGCCEKRCLAKGRGIGHCTTECWCCEATRGHPVTEEEDLEDGLNSENPSHLLTMTEAYFSKPGIFGLGKLTTMRSVVWYWKKAFPWRLERGSK